MGGAAGSQPRLTNGNNDLSDAIQRLIGEAPSRSSFINAPVITPDTGASRYWYVDPRAKTDQQRQQEYDDNEGHDEAGDLVYRLRYGQDPNSGVDDSVIRRVIQSQPQPQNIEF